jgi:hypothetical protein
VSFAIVLEELASKLDGRPNKPLQPTSGGKVAVE